MYSLIRPLLFTLDPERAHALTLSALHYLPPICCPKLPEKPVHALGLTFAHPVGLAAGLDKNGTHLDALAKLGFSHIELGTVTPKPQTGNPKPRLFRLPQAQAVINRMGFNNLGVETLVKNVEGAEYQGILGINIGKNKDTPLNQAVEDYLFCLGRVYPHTSYVTINISSPNTPDLRQLQQVEYLSDLLSELRLAQLRLAEQFKRHVPLVIKISPDESPEVLKHMTEIILAQGIEGIIATNTTSSRDAVAHLPFGTEVGGLSGQPVRALSTACLRLLREYTGDALTLIGVGGIDDLPSAQEKLAAGASLIQLYTGLVYKGPGLIADIVKGL